MGQYADLGMPGLKADYTITLGQLIAQGYDTDDMLHLSNKYYPLFDEAHRETLNRKILAHYALREIGAETPQQFLFYLGRRMNERAPYFNELYRTEALKYDILSDTDVISNGDSDTKTQSSGRTKAESNKTSTQKASQSASGTSDSESYNSEIPATGVENDFAKYATGANRTHGTTSNTTTSSGADESHEQSSASTDYQHAQVSGSQSQHTTGRHRSGAVAIMEYRRAILNIDSMIIDMLSDLFIQVYDTTDTLSISGQEYI